MSNLQTTEATVGCPPGRIVIPGHLAERRISAFADSNKYVVIDNEVQNAVQAKAFKHFELSLDSFVGKLRMFSSASNDDIPLYNGVRVYFVCYPDDPNPVEKTYVTDEMKGQMGLIFVPTFERTGAPTGEDDRQQYWHIGLDGQISRLPIPVPAPSENDMVTNWINRYRQQRMNVLEADGKTVVGPDFHETRSLWFDMRWVAGDQASADIGLINFIDCNRTPLDQNPIVALYVQWAAFLPEEGSLYPEYQLTLIFTLLRKNDPKPLYKNLPVISGLNFGSIKSDPADTGIPCPPAGNCVPGASFP